MCFVTWDDGHVIGGIGHCACGAGVIDVISTCEAIVQVGGACDFVSVGRLHVSFTSASSLAACSAFFTASHGLL